MNATSYSPDTQHAGWLSGSTGQIITMMMYTFMGTILTPMLIAGVSNVGEIFRKLLQWIKDLLFGEEAVATIVHTERMMRDTDGSERIAIDNDQYGNRMMIFAVLAFFSNKNLNSNCIDISISDTINRYTSSDATYEKSKSDNERWREKTLSKYPGSCIDYDRMRIFYSKANLQRSGNKSDKDDTKNETSFGGKIFQVTLTSRHKTTQELYAFINKCYLEYVDTEMPVKSVPDRYYYHQLKVDFKGFTGIRFSRYPMNYRSKESAFDGVFIPEEQMMKIIRLLDRLASGRISKVVFLLYGPPGTGKTTMARAIAAYSERDLMSPKLSYIENDDQLMQIFFSEQVAIADRGMSLISTVVPLNQRALLLEDFDAETDTTHCRIKADGDKKSDKQSSSSPHISINLGDEFGKNSSDKSTDKKGFTMSGYLNTTDGVKQLEKALIIMSANHPELLDEAVLRDGRITYAVHLQEMKAVDAHRMIRYHFDGQSVSNSLIKDGELLPAALQGLCVRCETIEEVEEGIPVIREEYRLKRLERESRKGAKKE
jgi:hypothetical protein